MNKCRRLRTLSAAAALAVLLSACETPAAAGASFSKLVWQDEFEGTAVNEADWTFETGAGGWGNNEAEYYRKENSAIQAIPGEAGRALVITAKANDGAYGYTSSRLKTQGKRSFTFGRIEARLKLPQGQGIWPAFWMLGESIGSVGWPKCSELDIMEMIGGNPASSADVNNRTTVGTLHWWGTAHQYKGKSYTLPTRLSADFHVYAVEWNASQILWLVDGVEYQRQSITSAEMDEFRQPAFLLLNLAVGGNWPGSPDGTTVFPQEYWIDWIRVYQ